MPLKRALLASAATPLLALSLTTSPSLANSATTTATASGAIQLAQAEQPPEELRKRPREREGQRPQGEGPQGGRQAQPQGGKGEAPEQAEQPKRQRQQEQAQPQRKQAQPERQQEQAEPRKRREQAEPERQRGEAKPERRQEREAKPERRQAEQPQRRQQEQERKAEPSERRKKAEPEQKPAAAERQKPKAEPSERQAAEPKSEEKTAEPKRKENAGKAERQRDQGEKAKPKSEETAKPQPRKGEEPKSEQAKPAEKQAPQQRERNATAHSGEEKPAGNAERRTRPAEQQGETAGQPKPQKPGEGQNARQAQPENGQQPPARTAQPVQPQGENAPKLAPLKSLNDQPARKAAEPASADAKPQTLDVPNGAPVLDSAKDRDSRRGRDRDRAREQRREQRAQQRQEERRQRQPVEIRSVTAVQGERIQQAPTFEPPQNVTIEKEVHNRYIVNVDNRTYIENNDYDRISHRAEDVYYERLPQDNYRQVVVRPNGVRVVTIRNRYGDILQRSRIRDGQETVLIYAPDYDRDQRDLFYQPVDLPPIRLTEPVDEYILDAEDAAPEQYVTFLEKPPIEPIEQVYTLDQVRYSARLRDIMPRIDLDTITFATGSAVIEQSQEQSLEALANAINDILQDDPGQVFLVEGHTDAVGSDQSNLILSDQRAESVAAALTQDFDVPPENLVTQGYGEQYLKIETEGPSRENRRVAIRRITPLIRPTAQR